MGMSYQFYKGLKSEHPNYMIQGEGREYHENTTGWEEVTDEIDREDWLPSFISEQGKTFKRPFYGNENVRAAISELRQLDNDVNTILSDERYDLPIRQRLAKGLVSNIYGYREYHYGYPKSYYSLDSYEMTHWDESVWENRNGSKYIIEQLQKLLAVDDTKYYIKCIAL